MGPAPDAQTVVRSDSPLDVRRTLGSLRRGGGDPHYAVVDGAVVRACRSPLGPVTVLARARAGGREVDVQAWGAGAEWAVANAGGLVGAEDDVTAFRPEHPLVRDLHRRHGGLRVPRTRLVFEVLVPAILEQKVTGAEAHRSWRELLWRFGEPAPGWPRLRVMPAPEVLAQLPSWEWHRSGVDAKRAAAIRHAAVLATRVEECAAMPVAEARRRLLSLPGVGIWTAAEVAQRALGDADAVSVGDYHLHTVVGYALAGRDVDDPAMVELLEPFRPHRFRVTRLLEIGVGRPRFGPRMPVRNHRAY